MKRLIVAAALLVVSSVSEAQVLIRSNRDDNVKTVSSTVVKKEVIYKERKLYDARRGFQQFIEVSPKIDLWDEEYGHTGINYIGGWRFNNWLFVGAGTGLEFAHDVAHGARQYVGESLEFYTEDKYYESSLVKDLNISTYGSVNLISIPLYAHIRTYYMRTAWAPYSSVSLGGRLAPKDSGIYFDFSTGVDYRVNDKMHAYLSIGFWLSKFRGIDYLSPDYDYYGYRGTCADLLCPYRGKKDSYGDYFRHYHSSFSDIFIERDISYGLSFRLGVSF